MIDAYAHHIRHRYACYIRHVRLETQLCGRESDRRNPQDVLTWTRYTRKETIMRTIKVAVIVWTLWSLQGNELKQIEVTFTSQEACITESFRLAYLHGVETRCMGDYSLTRESR